MGTRMATGIRMATAMRTARRDLDRAFAIGIAINVAFVVVEAFFGWRADSLALLADAGHNLGDVLGLVLAWAGAFAGRLAPDERHTYGWKRASILAAFANSLLLLVAIGSLAWAAIGRLAAPAPIDAGIVMVVAAIGIVVNGATALLFLRDRHGDLNARGAFLHMAADAAVSAGVVVAAALTLRLGWAWLDPAVTPGDRARHPDRHLGLVPRLAAPHVRRRAVLDRSRCRARRARGAAGRRLRQRPARLGHRHDQVALTAHLVTPGGHPDDAFFRAPRPGMQKRFAIGHVTLQAATETLMAPCDGAPPQPRPSSHWAAHEIQGLLRDPRRGAHRLAGRDQDRRTASSPASTTPTSASCPTPRRASRKSTRRTRS